MKIITMHEILWWNLETLSNPSIYTVNGCINVQRKVHSQNKSNNEHTKVNVRMINIIFTTLGVIYSKYSLVYQFLKKKFSIKIQASLVFSTSFVILNYA